jgi:hypothetical protein
MNIFVLDEDPVLAAQYQCDKHVVKMSLESAQILATVARKLLIGGFHGDLYKSTHKNHPCTLWAGSSYANFYWLVAHARALCEEYQFRYHKVHSALKQVNYVCIYQYPTFPRYDLTPFALAMPEEFRSDNAVESYRRYYSIKKRSIAKWSKSRPPPEWWTQ